MPLLFLFTSKNQYNIRWTNKHKSIKKPNLLRSLAIFGCCFVFICPPTFSLKLKCIYLLRLLRLIY